MIIALAGLGKTLAAFPTAIDRLMFSLAPVGLGCRMFYNSSLKALAIDVERNLRSADTSSIRRGGWADPGTAIVLAKRGGRQSIECEPFYRSTISLRLASTHRCSIFSDRVMPHDIHTFRNSALILLTSGLTSTKRHTALCQRASDGSHRRRKIFLRYIHQQTSHRQKTTRADRKKGPYVPANVCSPRCAVSLCEIHPLRRSDIR